MAVRPSCESAPLVRAYPPGLCPIVLASDENFAMPLATTLCSLAETNRRHWPLDVTVLTDGMPGPLRKRVEASLPVGSALLRWCVIGISDYADLPVMPHHSRMTFARFQMEKCFDFGVDRVLYLDADTLVLDDIAPLVATDLGDAVVAAVPDAFVDARLRTGPGHRPAGTPDVDRYFNAGVLVIDIPRWRAHEVSNRAVEYLASHPDTRFADQDGLNVACQGAWKPLPERWNFQDRWARIHRMPVKSRPAILHFVTGYKPWMPSSASPYASLYASYRARTRFRQSPQRRALTATATLLHRIRNRVRRIVRRRVVRA